MYTSEAKIEKILSTSFGEKCLFSWNRICFPKSNRSLETGVSKLFQIDLAFLDVRLVIAINIFILVFLSLVIFFVFVFNNVTGFAVSEFNQIYEILG